jgi:hypothetical protein
LFDDSECECFCHATDQDGFDEWDDDEARARGPKEEKEFT